MAASLAHLQGALTLQPGGEALRGVSASQWRQLQAIAALSAQRLRLQGESSRRTLVALICRTASLLYHLSFCLSLCLSLRLFTNLT